MLARTVLLAISACVSLVAAQGQLHTEYDPDVNQVEPSVLNSWCPSQRAVCPQICGGGASPNECYADTLTYTCTCVDGSKPDFLDYAGTLESEACEAYVSQCVAGNTTNPHAQHICLSNKCGKKDPSSVTKGSGGSGGTKTGGSGGSSTSSNGGSGGSSSSQGGSGGSGGSAPTDNAAPLIQQVPALATPAVAGVVLAAFGLAL